MFFIYSIGNYLLVKLSILFRDLPRHDVLFVEVCEIRKLDPGTKMQVLGVTSDAVVPSSLNVNREEVNAVSGGSAGQ